MLVQQIFSLLKQSPTGAVRLPDLRRITPADAGLDDEHLRAICSNLVGERYLQGGRIGEWRPGPALDELLDAHEIYSNIGSDPLRLIIVDAFSGRTIAQTDRVSASGGDTLLLGGRSMEVVWRDGYRIGVRAGSQAELEDILQITATPFAVPLDVSQGVAAYLGLAPGQLCILQEAGESWLFHFWGELYGALLADMLQRAQYPDLGVESWGGTESGEEDDEADELIQVRNEYCIRLPEPIVALPPWDVRLARQALNRQLPRFEPTLNLGRFHNLLPPAAAHAVAVSLCNMPRLRALYEAAQIVAPPADVRSTLRRLI
ncbi:MAG: hypothetical protein R2911_14275 [Caldilineaceae bacterium]